jgi:hypothetical protein
MKIPSDPRALAVLTVRCESMYAYYRTCTLTIDEVKHGRHQRHGCLLGAFQMLFDHQFHADLALGVSLGRREAMALEIAFPGGLSLP